MPSKEGGTCLTLLLNQCGTIEGEATIARMGKERFWFITGGPSERRVWDWLTVHERGDEQVEISNKSEQYGILTVAGPRARDVLAPICDHSLDNQQFAWLQARECLIAGVPVIAMRMSFSGLLAWELHAANEHLGALWDAIWQQGQAHRIVPFGAKALDMLRMEKAYRGGHELANDATPIHTAQMRFVKFDKDFVGKIALQALQRTGTNSVIAYLHIDAEDADVLGGEAVYLDGELVGSISSGNYGPICQQSLAFAYIKPAAASAGTRLQVMIFGELYDATVLAEPTFDPQNQLLRRPRAMT